MALSDCRPEERDELARRFAIHLALSCRDVLTNRQIARLRRTRLKPARNMASLPANQLAGVARRYSVAQGLAALQALESVGDLRVQVSDQLISCRWSNGELLQVLHRRRLDAR